MTKAKAAHEHWEKQQRRKQEQQRLQQEADAAAAEEEEEESDKDAEQQEEKEQTEEEDSSEGDSEQGKAGTSTPQRATRFDERTRVLTQQALDRFEAMGALYASRAPPADDPNLVVCESGGQYTRQELAAWQKLAVPLPCLQQLAVEL